MRRTWIAQDVRGSLAVAAAVWLLVDLWRVWTPALITVFGQAAATPPELIGAFALGCMGLPLVLILLGRGVWSQPGALPALLGLAGVARLVLAFGPGGRLMLYVAAAGVVVASTWLCLATARLGRPLVVGLVGGVALASSTHAALGGLGAVWRSDAWGWLATIALLVLLGATATGTEQPDRSPLSRRAAWLLFPSLLLAGIVLANVGRASAMHDALGPLFTVVGCWLAVGVLSGVGPRLASPLLVRGAAGVLVVVTTVLFLPFGSHQLLSPWLAPLLLLGMPSLAITLAGADRSARGADSTPTGTRPAIQAAGGAVVWVLVLFAYYAGYDLGYTAHWLVPLLAIVIAVTGAGRGRPELSDEGPRFPVGVALAAVLAGGLAVIGPWATLPGPPQQEAGADDSSELVVMAYNLRMGYGMNGRFTATQVANLIRDRDADVVLLSEIDRGWLLNGGQDQLHVLARLTGMTAVFGPAADPVWGDAILTRLPVSEVSRHQFASYDALTGAQALSATLEWHGGPVRAIVTHLQPGDNETNQTMGQARELAELMSQAASRHERVVVAGDLNTTPGSAAWRVLTATGYVDALAASRPLLTDPSDEPDEELDHVLVTRSLRPSSPRTLDVTWSDHLPVEVLLGSNSRP